jgi:hypothetical protein
VPVIDLGLVPIPATPGRYAAMLDGREMCRSRQPLLDVARLLLVLGEPPETVLTTRHQGSGIVAQRSTVGEAAKWTIEETSRDGPRRVPWTAARHGRGRSGYGPPEAGDGHPAVPVPPEAGPTFPAVPPYAADDFAGHANVLAPHAKRGRE